MLSYEDLTTDIVCRNKIKDCPVTSAHTLRDAIAAASCFLEPGEELVSQAEELDDCWIFDKHNPKRTEIIIGGGVYVISKADARYGVLNYPAYFVFGRNARKVPFTTDP